MAEETALIDASYKPVVLIILSLMVISLLLAGYLFFKVQTLNKELKDIKSGEVDAAEPDRTAGNQPGGAPDEVPPATPQNNGNAGESQTAPPNNTSPDAGPGSSEQLPQAPYEPVTPTTATAGGGGG